MRRERLFCRAYGRCCRPVTVVQIVTGAAWKQTFGRAGLWWAEYNYKDLLRPGTVVGAWSRDMHRWAVCRYHAPTTPLVSAKVAGTRMRIAVRIPISMAEARGAGGHACDLAG